MNLLVSVGLLYRITFNHSGIYFQNFSCFMHDLTMILWFTFMKYSTNIVTRNASSAYDITCVLLRNALLCT